MKKIIAVIFILMLSQPVFASWSQKDRTHFAELLWLPEAEKNVDVKVRMLRFISCITSYYEAHYPFAGVLEKWNSAPVDIEWISEFIAVNERCDAMIADGKDVREI